MINVIHSYPIWLPQTQTWMYNQVRFLPREIVRSHIVCERTENLDQFRIPNIYSLHKLSPLRYYWEKAVRKLGFSSYNPFLIEQARKLKAPLLHTHFGHFGWKNIVAAKKCNMKHIVTFYGLDVHYLPTNFSIWKSRYMELFEHVDCILCEGSYMADSIHKLGCPKDKIRIHHLGIDVSSVPFKPRVWAKGQVLKVLIASTFAEKKGIPYAIEALGGLKDDFPIEITIIGDAKNTKPGLSEKRKIIRIINDYQLHSNVKMLGLQPHSRLMEEAYKNHIFIAPSITGNDGMTEGGAPVTLIDMAATGMPIISSFHCDIPEVIRHKETGLLSKERSVTELRNNIKWFIDNPEQWDILLTAGRKHLKNEYNSPKLGNSLSSIYKEIIS